MTARTLRYYRRTIDKTSKENMLLLRVKKHLTTELNYSHEYNNVYYNSYNRLWTWHNKLKNDNNALNLQLASLRSTISH